VTVTSRFAAGALCGIAAGIVTGAAARIAMRMVADGVPDGIGQRPDFTLLGTLAIVGAGAVAGAGVGILFELTHDGLPGPRRLRGLVFAAALLALVGPLFFLGSADEFITTQRVILFSLLFPIYGAAAGLALPVCRQLAARLDRRARLLLALVGLGSGLLVAGALPGLALQAIELRGATALGLLVPWVAVACAVFSRRYGRPALPRRGLRA
jgi:hypothetical protein